MRSMVFQGRRQALCWFCKRLQKFLEKGNARCRSLGAIITDDSRMAIFTKPGDSLGIVVLGTDHCEYIPNVGSHKSPKGDNSKWLAYQLDGPDKVVVLRSPHRAGKAIYWYTRILVQ